MGSGREDEYYTCEELIEKYPFVGRMGWNARSIGIFRSAFLLVGHKSGKEGKVLILESSFLELIDFTNRQSDNRMYYKKNS